MHQFDLDLQASIDFAGDKVKRCLDLYSATKLKLPSSGPKIDANVQKYLSVLENWTTAGFNWGSDSSRYFGKDVQEVRRTLRVRLLPQVAPTGQSAIPDLDRAS